MPETQDKKPLGTLRPLNQQSVKPQGQLKPFTPKTVDSPAYNQISGGSDFTPYAETQEIEQKVYEVKNYISNLPEFPGNDKDKKDILFDIAAKNPTSLKDAILTFSGKHPKQQGGLKYYMNDNGLPVPIANSERPPEGYETASLWGSQKQAEKDPAITAFSKQVMNMLPALAENVIDLVHLPYGASTGNEAEWYKSLKNSAQYLQFPTASKSKAPVLNSEGIDEFGDIFDGKNWNFTADNVAGTAGQIVKSVGEFVLGAKGIGSAAGITNKSSKAAKLATGFTASYMTNLGEALDEGRSAGIDTKDAYRLAAAITVPIAMVDLGLGVEGRIFRDQIANQQTKELRKNLITGFLKDSKGEITKEGLDGLFKATLTSYTGIAKTWGKEFAKDMAGEGGQEALQSFIQKGGQQIYDNLSDSEKKKFGTDAFGPKAVAEYINEGIAGALGGGVSGLAYNRIRNIEKENRQSKTAFGLVQKGDDAIKSYKHNILNEQQQGKLSSQEANNAITRINAYKEYNDIIGSLSLPEEKKREAFDKTFQKQNIESELRNYGDPLKLHPLKQGEYKAKEKLADELQKDITAIMFEAQTKEETIVPEKVIKDESKKADQNVKAKQAGTKKPKISPVMQAFLDKYKKKNESEEEKLFTDIKEKTFDHIPDHAFNSGRFDARDKHRVTFDFLKSRPDERIEGATITERPVKAGEGKSVFGAKFPGSNKVIRFASSMKRKDEYGRGWLSVDVKAKTLMKQDKNGYWSLDEEKVKDAPIGLKAYTIGKDKRAIKIYYAGKGEDYGKFIGWAKATNTGQKKEFTPEEDNQLIDIMFNQETPPTAGSPEIAPTAPINSPEGQEQLEDIALKAQPITTTNVQEYNGKQPTQESAVAPAESTARNDNQADKSVSGESSSKKEITKRRGTKRSNQKIKDPLRKKALEYDVYTPYELALQYFIGRGHVSTESIRELYGKNKNLKGELFDNARNYALSEKKGGKSIDAIAHSLMESNSDLNFKEDSYRNAIEDIIASFQYKTDMAKHLIKSYEANNEAEMNAFLGYNPEMEQALNNVPPEYEEDVDDGLHEMEPLSDETLIEMSENKDDFNEWFDVMRAGSKDLYIAYQKKQLEEQADYDESSDKFYDSYFGQKYDALKIGENVGQFQKKSSRKGDIFKVAAAIKKAMPKIKIEYDYKLKHAGHLSRDGKTIRINPYYAGIDTPIHEAGHVLIDAMGGTSNRVIRKAINQLKGTKLWNEISKDEDYSKLSEDMLGKEVLAEAIGREGAGIFEEQSAKNQFRAYLEYFFDWMKRNLWLEKNIAKSLAKQIISGINTKNLSGTNTGVVQRSKKKFPAKEFRKYREDVIGVNVKEEKATLQSIEDIFDNETLSEEETQELIETRDNILSDIAEDKEAFNEYRKNKAKLLRIGQATDFSGFTLNDLIEAYRNAQQMKEEGLGEIKLKLAEYINHTRMQELKTVDPEIEGKVNQSDMKYIDRFFKVLNDATEKFPPLQGLSKEFDRRWMAKTRQANELHKEHDRFGKAVIREKNALLGKVSDVFSSNSAKYFEFVEDDGKLRTNTAGLTTNQKKYLEFIHKITQNRKKEFIDDDGNIVDNTLLKTDKGFWETKKSDGYKAAWAFIIKSLSPNEKRVTVKGELKSRFDQPYKGDSYSKDFFRATHEFIDESSHIENMKDLVPVVDAVEAFYQAMGQEEGQSFNNTLKFLEKWKTNKLYRQMEATSPTLDMMFRNLRKLTTARVMGFNLDANLVNVAIGNFGTFRDDSKVWAVGQKRFATDIKKSIAIAKHYDLVSTDYEVDPKTNVGKLFTGIAYVGMKWGETQIQVSQFVGQMSDEEWNSFQYNDGKLTVTNKEEKFEDKIISYRNHVSEIQGRYSEKDRRNYMNTEGYKLLGQFSTWIPEWYKARMGKEFIDSHNKIRRGTWNMFTERAMKEIKADWKNGKIFKNKQVMANLKGATIVAALLIATYQDDEDKKRKKKAISLENGLNNLLFVFDINQLEWKVKQPAPVFGTVGLFLDALHDMMKSDGNKFRKDAKKLLPYNKVVDVPKQIEGLTK